MPSAAENLELIESTLKASLSQGKQLDQNVASAAQRVLLHKIEFVPSTKPHSVQFSSLKSKYVLLQPGASSLGKKQGKTASGQEESAEPASFGQSGEDAVHDKMNGPGSSGDSQSHMGDSLPSPRVVIYPPEKVKLEWHQTPRIGAGLVNLGNTCFFNSTLQCLTYTAPLVNYCFSEEHPNTCKQQSFCLMCELRRHIKSCFQNSGHAFKPQMMLQKLRYIAKHMRWGRQEDAHEFLRHLVDGLQRACLNGHAKLDKFSKETTVINQIFGGFLRSQVQCMKCHARSNTYDPFMDLSLDIKQSSSLEDALAKFVKVETLDSENAYKCEKCHQKVPAKKRFSIHQAPNVLTLQLNRFDFHRSAGKINRFIMFPEKLNIRPYMSQRQGEPIYYYLYGVLIHSGFNCNSGHYYCYVKAPNKNWYLMNDSLVQTIPAQRVFQAEAYLLFYSRAVPAGSQQQTKSSYVSPSSNGLVTANKFANMNGSHSKLVHNHQTTPVKSSNDVGVHVSRQLLSPAVPSPAVPSTSTSTVGMGSSLPEKHKKIVFGIGAPKPFQPVQQQHNVQQHQSQKDSAPSTNGPNKRRIVMHIKNGKVTTIEKSPDGKSKVVKGEERRPSTLVPYAADSDSSDESSASHKAGEKKEKHIGKENRVVENEPKIGQPAVKKEAGVHDDGHAQTSAVPPTGKHGGVDTAEARKDLTLKLNRDNVASIRKMSIELPSPSRVNATSSNWTVQMQDSAPSPSLGSCSSNNSTHSVNSTTDWHVQDMGEVKTSAADRKLQHVGWTVTESPTVVSVEKTDSAKGDARLSETSQRQNDAKHTKPKASSSADESLFDRVTSSGDGERVHPWVFPEKMHSGPSFRGDADSVSFNSAQDSEKHRIHTGHQKDSSANSQSYSAQRVSKTDRCTKDLKTENEGVNGHSESYSDKQPLLSQDSTEHKKHKKHRKKKHKRDKEREHSSVNYQTLQDSCSSSTDTPAKHKHKKKKRKSYDYGDSDSERREKRRKEHDDSDSGHKGKRHRDHQDDLDEECTVKKRRKSESEESEYMWEEKTKETLAAAQEQLQKAGEKSKVPAQAWDLHVRDSLGHSRHEKANGQGHSMKASWDGSRKPHVAEELEKRPAVMSWNGERSQADIEAERERERKQRKTWSDLYEEDIDKGKVKKVKNKHRDDDRHVFNIFQKFQNYLNESKHDKEKWKDGHDSHKKSHSHHSSPSSLGRSYSDQAPYRHSNNQNRDYHSSKHRNGHSSHYSFHRSHSHSHSYQNFQKRY